MGGAIERRKNGKKELDGGGKQDRVKKEGERGKERRKETKKEGGRGKEEEGMKEGRKEGGKERRREGEEKMWEGDSDYY